PVRARRHAARHRAPLERGDRALHAVAGNPGAPAQRGCALHSDDAGRILGLRQGGDREVGAGGESFRGAGGLIAMAAPKLLWEPTERAIEEAQLTQFARQVIRKRKLEFNTYPDFYRWTVESPEEFWSDLWDWSGIVAAKKGGTVLADGAKMPGAKWFPEAR